MDDSGLSWGSKQGIGGIVAAKIEAQDWYVFANIGLWLADPEFTSIGIETADDLTVHYLEHGPQDVQIKSADLGPAGVRDVLQHFAEKEAANPNHYSSFKLVARSFGEEFNGLSLQLRRLRLARRDAPEGDRAATEATVRARARKSIGSSIPEDLLLDKIELEYAPTSAAAVAESHCKEGLRLNFGELGPAEADLAVKYIGDHLRNLRVSAGGPLTRVDVEMIIERARQQVAQSLADHRAGIDKKDFVSVRGMVSRSTSDAAQALLSSRAGTSHFERSELTIAVGWIDQVGVGAGALFVVGDSGQGKSILLAQSAMRLMSDERFLPIWIDLSSASSFPPLTEFELSIGVRVGEVIAIALENGVRPLLFVDTFDAIDPGSMGVLLQGTDGAALLVSDRPSHFRIASDGRVDTRDVLELPPLQDDEKNELFAQFADAYGVGRRKLSDDELRASSTPQDIRWIALALASGTPIDPNSPVGLIRSIWERTIVQSTDRSFVASAAERGLVGLRKQQIVYALAELSLTGAKAFPDRLVLQMAGADAFGTQALAELLADGILATSLAGYTFAHAAILEWARTQLTLQEPDLLSQSTSRETFEAEYSEARLAVSRCLEEGDSMRAWEQVKRRLERGDNKSGLAGTEVLFENPPCLYVALPELVSLLHLVPWSIGRLIIEKLGKAYESCPPALLHHFDPIVAEVFLNAEGGGDG